MTDLSDMEKQIYVRPEMEVFKLDDSDDNFLTTSGGGPYRFSDIVGRCDMYTYIRQ